MARPGRPTTRDYQHGLTPREAEYVALWESGVSRTDCAEIMGLCIERLNSMHVWCFPSFAENHAFEAMIARGSQQLLERVLTVHGGRA